MRIDSHQHFWKYDSQRDSWINDEMKVLKKDFMPADLKIIFKENLIDGCVAVQADQSERETEFLLNLANKNQFIKGVVGWVDLRADNIKEQLTHASLSKIVKGFRHIAQAEPSGFLLGEKFHRGISELSGFNFTYDILIHENQLLEALTFTKNFPDQKFVIDHIAKPNIKAKSTERWKRVIQQYAPLENVYCKLSGLVTENNWHQWK
jgi:L-fuconolactonase